MWIQVWTLYSVQGVPKNVFDFKRQLDVSKLMQSNILLLTMANLWSTSTPLPLHDVTLRATGYSNRWRETPIDIRNPHPLT